MTDLSKTQLATILSALDGERRSPANRDAALKAIGKSAVRLGLTAEAVLAAAPGLLDGRLDAVAWRAQLTERPEPPAGERIAASLRVAFPDLPDGLAIEADGEQAVLVDRVSKWVIDLADRDDAATHARWRKAVAGIRKNLAAGKPIAPGDPRVPAGKPEAVKPARKPKSAEVATPRSREGTKEAMLIAMLRRPEGATIAQVIEATGWQPHTVRGAISGALKKKRGLEVTSDKNEAGERAYKIAGG
ncbi:MAG: DUF3489 domain-containing protein [Geminicoccaceae bacterium]